MKEQKTTWLDVYLGKYRWYRKLRGGEWWYHVYTDDAAQIGLPVGKTFWARYDTINRYSTTNIKEFN